jgi:hypothetical protein
MRYRFPLVGLIISIGIITSCGPVVEPPVDMGYRYIPIDTGRYYIYDVDSVYIDCVANINDTVHYQLKETYPSLFIDGMGDTVINITRYYRTDHSQPWSEIVAPPDVWWLKRTTTRLEKTEENLTFVKMTYPIDVNYEWDGNAYNVLGQQFYHYGDQDISFNNGFANFDSTITVYHQEDTSSLIQYYLFTETYARNIGMIYKMKINIPNAIYNDSSNPGNVNSCWQDIPFGLYWFNVYILQRIKLGSLVTYKLIEYGFE